MPQTRLCWRRFEQPRKMIYRKKKRERKMNDSRGGREQDLRQQKGTEEPAVLPPLHAFSPALPHTGMKTLTEVP